jgi:peptidoglycan/xylan/chitin deacetylase (PgdA/CDA1 family)
MDYLGGPKLRFSLLAAALSLAASGCGDEDVAEEEPLAINKAPAAPPATDAAAPLGTPADENAQMPLGAGQTDAPMFEEEPINPLYDCTRSIDVNSYDVPVNIPASQSPPGGLPVEDTPLFVAFGIDDNYIEEGMKNMLDGLIGQGVDATFFHISGSLDNNKTQWLRGAQAGFEVANHTKTHNTSITTDATTWGTEISNAYTTLSTNLGTTDIFGFRAPKLEYNDALFGVLEEQGYWYDSSIEGGFDPTIDGTNFYFPYTLDTAGPDLTYLRGAYKAGAGFSKADFDVTPRPGLLEIAITSMIIPPDDVAAEYGFEPAANAGQWNETPSFRERVKQNLAYASQADFERIGYKIEGLDYNLETLAKLTPSEILTVLKYNFDLHRAGNRAPFVLGAHSNYYPTASDPDLKALIDFIAYVKTFPEVRVVSYKEVFDFMREPKALSCY